MVVPIDDETCNREKDFHYKEKTGFVTPQLYLISTYDPGLWILLPGFTLVIMLMVWYFYQIISIREGRKISELEE
jgi:uncharacterized membrane protein